MALSRFIIVAAASVVALAQAHAGTAYDCTMVTNPYADSGTGTSCTTFYPKANAKDAAEVEFWGDAIDRCDNLYDSNSSFYSDLCELTLESHLDEGYYTSVTESLVYGLYPTHSTNHGSYFEPGQCITASVNSPTFTYTLTDLGSGCWRAVTQSINYRCGCKVKVIF